MVAEATVLLHCLNQQQQQQQHWRLRVFKSPHPSPPLLLPTYLPSRRLPPVLLLLPPVLAVMGAAAAVAAAAVLLLLLMMLTMLLMMMLVRHRSNPELGLRRKPRRRRCTSK